MTAVAPSASHCVGRRVEPTRRPWRRTGDISARRSSIIARGARRRGEDGSIVQAPLEAGAPVPDGEERSTGASRGRMEARSGGDRFAFELPLARSSWSNAIGWTALRRPLPGSRGSLMILPSPNRTLEPRRRRRQNWVQNEL